MHDARMRIRISHETVYRYERAGQGRDPDAAADAAQSRRPVRGRLAHRRVGDCRLDAHEDAFGNITHAFTADGPLAELQRAWSRARSKPRTPAASCAARSSAFRRACICATTPLTGPTARSRLRARRRARATATTRCRLCTPCSARMHERDRRSTAIRPMRRPRRPRPSRSSAACARTSPTSSSRRARSSAFRPATSAGYFHRADGVTRRMPATPGRRPMCPRLGWVGFDPANGICPTDAHVRVAVGLDYLGAAPVRGARYGGGGESWRSTCWSIRRAAGAELTAVRFADESCAH